MKPRKFKLIKEHKGCDCKLGEIIYTNDEKIKKYPHYWKEIREDEIEISDIKRISDDEGLLFQFGTDKKNIKIVFSHKQGEEVYKFLEKIYK